MGTKELLSAIRQEIKRLNESVPYNCDRHDEGLHDAYHKVLKVLDTLAVEDTGKLRYCIEYINPRFPRLHNGSLNIRHLRVPNERGAEMAITLILSFGGKIYALYRGNLKDGKLADWPTPMIVDEDDWYTDEWLNDLLDCGHSCH